MKESLQFSKIESDKVFKILKNFDESKAPGIDDLSGIFLKDSASLLATPITQLCNLSILSGRFPDACKIAKLKPLFKKDSKTNPKNYCPISLLPLMSKVQQRIVQEQSIKFLDKHNILNKFQSGFRKNHSIDFCLPYLTDKIFKGFDSGLLTGVILSDLQKAFDTIDHNIFLLKIQLLGFSREVIDWYKSYLSSRKLHVNVHDKFSISADLRCRVPQVSIVGPLLFLLYINDMPQAADYDLLLYADDTRLLFQYKDLEQIKEELTKNFSNICDWFVDNKLSIHFGEDKTKSILSSSKNRKRKIETLNIQYGDVKIKQYSNVTYLGCELGERLSGRLWL